MFAAAFGATAARVSGVDAASGSAKPVELVRRALAAGEPERRAVPGGGHTPGLGHQQQSGRVIPDVLPGDHHRSAPTGRPPPPAGFAEAHDLLSDQRTELSSSVGWLEVDLGLIERGVKQVLGVMLDAGSRRGADAQPVQPQRVATGDPILLIKRQELG